MHTSKILMANEIQAVLKSLHTKKSKNSRLNLTIFRLSCCCGLRVKEIVGLDMDDVMVNGPRPVIRIRKEITKGPRPRARLVPLWWDTGTLEDLTAWKEFRSTMPSVATGKSFVCGTYRTNLGQRFDRVLLGKRWKSILKAALGPDRARQLSIHCGRHSFCSHALYAGRSLAEVRDAAGHRDVSTTGIYLHTLERERVPDIFAEGESDE